MSKCEEVLFPNNDPRKTPSGFGDDRRRLFQNERAMASFAYHPETEENTLSYFALS
jgi:hypothetical protein